MALSDDKLWDLWNAQGTDNMSKEEAFVFARAIEAEARRDALEEAAALIDRGYLDASVRMDPKRDHSVSDWFRRQQAAAIRALIPGEPK